MELEEMKSLWQKNNSSPIEIKINRKEMDKKLRKSLDKLKIKRLFNLIIACITIPVISFGIVLPRALNDGSTWFYISTGMFIVSIIASFSVLIYYYIHLLKIEASDTVFETQKKITHLETVQKYSMIAHLFFAPLTLICFFKIVNLPWNEETIVCGIVIFIIMVLSCLKELNWRIPNDFKKIKDNLTEINEWENEAEDK